jgi:hypothetical protein
LIQPVWRQQDRSRKGDSDRGGELSAREQLRSRRVGVDESEVERREMG